VTSRAVRARWVLPIDRPPLDGGWVEIDDGRIAAVGKGHAPARCKDLGDVALLPGLVNAHTHLELSWMAGQIPPADSMAQWIQALLSIRKTGPLEGAPSERDAARQAIEAMRAAGTVLVGDISNTLATPELLAEVGMGGVVFHELIGFRAPDPAAAVREAWARVALVQESLPAGGELALSVAAHAPYSVSPALFTEIARRVESAPLTVHLAESPEEIEFLRTGRGAMRDMLERLGAWTPSWQVPRCDPVEYLAGVGYLQPGVLVVHGVHLTAAGLERLRRAQAVLVTCPRSNLWVGAGSPNLAQFFDSGVPVAIGTDSLASVPTLNLFDELAEMRRLAPEVSASSLLESATRIGANALGLGHRYGTIAPGKRAALVTVRLPGGVTDVEECLVGGIAPHDIGVL
jgi:cytosine/adenosine deaminase-related metal-dependent hydrolase